MQASGLSVSDDQVRALARELLAREEFARWRRPPGALEQLRQALLEWSHGAVQWLRGAVGLPPIAAGGEKGASPFIVSHNETSITIFVFCSREILVSVSPAAPWAFTRIHV